MRARGLPLSLCRLVSDLLYSALVLPECGPGADGGPAAPRSSGGRGRDSVFHSLSEVAADIDRMAGSPDAFLHGTVGSRWDLVFNNFFGREDELSRIGECCDRAVAGGGGGRGAVGGGYLAGGMGNVPAGGTRQVLIISGHAGRCVHSQLSLFARSLNSTVSSSPPRNMHHSWHSGKSKLVMQMRKPLESSGWIFLRCKFGKSPAQPGFSVVALGLDEFFSGAVGTGGRCPDAPAGGAGCTPQAVCERLESAVGMDGLEALGGQMPCLGAFVGKGYRRRDGAGGGDAGRRATGRMHLDYLFGTVLETLAEFTHVFFFIDDVSFFL